MTDSARTEEIRARVSLSEVIRNTRQSIESMIPDVPHKALACSMLTELDWICDAELTALREEVERLKGALRAATHCPTCEGTGKMTLECMACLSGEPGARCTCAEETCAQCDGRRWATADGTGEELVAAALSPSPAQQEPESA